MLDPHQMNLNHLRYFYEVARTGNMRKAATRVGISQPALSKQIQALEDTIGLQLFFRRPKGLQPTPDGEVVFTYCERIFGHLRDLETELERRRTGSAGRLTLGAIHSISTHILPSFLHTYRDAFPHVRIKLTTLRSKQVLRALAEHRVDLGLIAEEPPADRFVGRPFQRTPLIPVVAPTHPLARLPTSPLTAACLDRADMVAFDPAAPTRRIATRYLDALAVEPRIVAECPSIDTLIAMVIEGLGFAILPSHSVAADLRQGRLVTLPIADWSLERTLYIVHLAGPSLPPPVRHFADLFPTLDAPRPHPTATS